jgi:zinc carboxypeptidase
MARRFSRTFLLLFVLLSLGPVSGAAAAQPPWCGTPQPDAAAALPDGTGPNDPVGSFPHIPYYAVGCTLQDIQSRSDGRMKMQVIGKSALGRDLYGVVINRLRTDQERRDYAAWLTVRAIALRDPAAAQRLLARLGDNVKVPVFIQGGIHGNEYEGVDAAIDTIEKYATAPYGQDQKIDAVLSHLILVFNPTQNPDGRIAGTRANGNGFDLNRDFLTQSQSETIASISLMKKWLAPEMLDMHGYVTPTLIEATTKPHNPSIEYDNWLKWNQPRIDANEAALNAIGQQITRPINDWCSDGNPAPPSGICPDGGPPGPAVAEGWDDWGPFYGPMYMQHVGLDSSTVEMCNSTTLCGGRAGSRQIQNVVQESTLEFVVPHRAEMLHDELENYRRGDVDAPRPECCPPPFDVDNNWMVDFPKAYVIPAGAGQRSDVEANRLVRWLLFNDIEVTELTHDTTFDGHTYGKRSYVVWMTQPRRGLADTALSLGLNISDEIGILYAPPASWSHGYLWGADVVTVPDGAAFDPQTKQIDEPNKLDGGIENGKANGYTLEIDSPTAVRTLNALVRDGVQASLAVTAFSGGAAGTAVFGGDKATEKALKDAGRESGLVFRRLTGAPPATEPIEKVPRFRVITGNNGIGATDQSTWVLRQLGFDAEPITIAQINTEASDPLAGYDLIYNAAVNYPSAANAQARTRLTAFFAGGGGYLGGQAVGSTFLASGGQAAGLASASDSGGGSGWSGILLWDNTGGANSLITGGYPARDTLIADPPTWLTSVPSAFTVDARLPASGFFAAGLWPNAGTSSAGGSAIVAHGPNTGGTARLTVFANNPLYRADPEREWPMVGTAAYWGDGN